MRRTGCYFRCQNLTVRSNFLVRLRNLVIFEVFEVKFSAKISIFQNCLSGSLFGLFLFILIEVVRPNFLNALYFQELTGIDIQELLQVEGGGEKSGFEAMMGKINENTERFFESEQKCGETHAKIR